MSARERVVGMASAGDSHIGLVRSENQDRHDSFDSPLGAIHLVADGMGGHCGGAKAAAMVVEGYRNALCSPSGPAEYRIALEAATAQTNREIHRLGRAGVPEYAGMGSTVVMALIRGWELVVAHVGDSRAYLCRGGRMLRLTRDHTAVQQLVDLGLLTETQARTHPTSSLLTRALGGESSVDIEISEPFSLLPGDTVMLCSDGLSGRVQDERIEGEIVRGHKNAESVVRSLISLALEAGGADNITVRCVRFNPPRKPAWNWLRTLI